MLRSSVWVGRHGFDEVALRVLTIWIDGSKPASINLGILKGVFPTSASLLADELDCLVICDLNGLAVREPAQVGLRPDDGRTGLTRQRDGPSWGKDVLPLGSEPTGAGNTRKRAQGQGHAPELALGTISFNSGSKSGGWFLRAVMVDSDRRRGLPRLLELARNNLCTSTGSGGSGSASGSGEHRHPACLYPLYPALHLAPMAQRGQLTLSIDATWRRRTHRTRCTRPYSAEMRDLGPSRHGSRKPWWPPPQRDHRHRRSRTCGARSARWVCRVDGSAITGGALPPALASPWGRPKRPRAAPKWPFRGARRSRGAKQPREHWPTTFSTHN